MFSVTRVMIFKIAVAVFWAAIICSALQLRLLDSFFPGTHHGCFGNDFFSVPQSFLNLLKGYSIYRNELFHGIDCSPYYYHPVLSLSIAPWLNLFSPWVAFYFFVLFSIAILFYSARLLGTVVAPRYKWLSYLSLLCATPLYLLLWNGQMHIFTILSVTLLLYGLLTINNADVKKNNPWIVTGLLFSLFSKPMLLLTLPLLFAYTSTRKTVLYGVIVYITVSAVFIFVPFLNPEALTPDALSLVIDAVASYLRSGDTHFLHDAAVATAIKNNNIIHWINIASQLSSISHPLELFSLANCIHHLDPALLNFTVLKLFAVIPVIFSLPIFFRQNKPGDPHLILLIFIALLYSYYLSYITVWEYHYTTLLPTIPVFFELSRRSDSKRQRTGLFICGCIACTFILPSLYAVLRSEWLSSMCIIVASRVLPVLAVYLLILYLIIDRIVGACRRQAK